MKAMLASYALVNESSHYSRPVNLQMREHLAESPEAIKRTIIPYIISDNLQCLRTASVQIFACLLILQEQIDYESGLASADCSESLLLTSEVERKPWRQNIIHDVLSFAQTVFITASCTTHAVLYIPKLPSGDKGLACSALHHSR